MNCPIFSFVGGSSGPWAITRISTVAGEAIPPATHLEIHHSYVAESPAAAAWVVRGFTSNLRYTTGDERQTLNAMQPPLGRPAATCGALIPIRKNDAWWDLPQDARRELFEPLSQHTTIGLGYLPAVARRLHHSRDLGEPFDFLTWFEFAPTDEPLFDELLAKLRATPEWRYVTREVDIRLTRAATT